MKLQHYTNNAYDTITLINEQGEIVGVYQDPEAVTNFIRIVVDGEPAYFWDANGSDWRPQEGVDALLAEWDGEHLTLHTMVEDYIHHLRLDSGDDTQADSTIAALRVRAGAPECPWCSNSGILSMAEVRHPETGELICRACRDQLPT